MKRFFSLFLMLLMFVGVSVASDTSDKVSTQTEFSYQSSAELDVVDFISDWLSDNFSSETDIGAILPNSMDIIIVNRPAKTILINGSIPIDLVFECKANKVILTQKVKSEVLTDFSTQELSEVIITKFTKDFKVWLNKMPQ